MISVPEMIMIGGNSRNSGKTTMACNCISKLSASHEVVGLKVTSVRPGEEDLHGKHNEDFSAGFAIFEELNPDSNKDTSKMLKAGAAHVYYIRAEENFTKQAILYFLSTYVNKQLIVCESRSLSEIVTPGMFLVMMKLNIDGQDKDMSKYLVKADKIFYFKEGLIEIKRFTDKLNFKNCKFVWSE